MQNLSCVLLLAVVSVILLSDHGRVLGHIQYSPYDFPSLYTFDDYDRCFRKNSTEPLSTTYCMVYAEMKPDNSSQLWEHIMHHWERNKYNYRYDRLYFGLCLERCKNYAHSAFSEAENALTKDNIINNEFTEYYKKLHTRPLDLEMREKYSQMVHKCINDDFQKKYNLKLQIFIEYCEGRNENEQQIALAEKDPAEWFLYKLFKILALLVVLSTLYDYFLKTKQTEENQTNEFYKNNLEQMGSRLCTSFSICRNYYRLVQPYRTSAGHDFAFLDGYRTVTTLGVTYAHTFFTTYLPVQNPEFYEFFFNSTIGSLLLNGAVGLQIFMVMTGLFVYIKFSQARYITPQTSGLKCAKIYILLLGVRLLRLFPSVAFFVLVNATVASRFVDGPFWRHIIDPNHVFSRKYWLKNILMINNFSQKESMSPHTWYLAMDIQALSLYLIVIILMFKYPQHKNRILKYCAIIVVVIPTCVTYILKLRSGFIAKGETYRHGYITDAEYYYQYTPFYNNLGGYIFGIWCGDFYLNQLPKQEVQQRLEGIIKYLYTAIPIAYSLFWLGSVMMVKEPSIWTAIFNGLHRNIWIICCCGFPMLGMVCKGGMVAYEFCCLSMFRVLSRLSFQMFLWHFLIIQVVQGYLRQPFHMNVMYFLCLTLLAFVLSAIVGFFIILFVEYPFAQLLESLQPKRKPAIKAPTNETKIQ